MKCPYCLYKKTKVIDSRTAGDSIRRRRNCLGCGRRFTTYERLENSRLLIIKKDGRREPFFREKLLGGLLKACEKRPIKSERIDNAVREIESKLWRKGAKEVSSRFVGELVMEKLKELDEVAYVRFASVYRRFKDARQFAEEVKRLGGRA